MPIFSPKPFQGVYLPVETDRQWLMRVLTALERGSKGILFGCRMCGNCILQETAFICPMTCAKGLRNGFCGEASEDRCVVDESRPCTWLKIFQRAEKMGRMERLLEINAPVDGSRVGHSAWIPLFRSWAARKQPFLPDLVFHPQKFSREWEELCYEFRQPAWWQGDCRSHPAASEGPVSRLQSALQSQGRVVTAEIEPPMDSDPSGLLAKVALLRQFVISSNFSDNAFATSRMSSLSCSKLCLEAGLEPVLQIQCRDRSRSAILSDAMGASALGIRNILCLGGDYHNKAAGPRPYQPIQFDVDAVQMLWMLRRLRDEGRHVDGREVKHPPKYFLGAAGAPFTLSPTYNAIRVEKKVNAGAQFIQTQMIFDTRRFADWLEALDKRSLLGRVAILAGVCPMRSAEDAHMFAASADIGVPDEYVQRMDRASEKDRQAKGNPDGNPSSQHQVEEGLQITVEIINILKTLPGIRGIHLEIGGQEQLLPRIMNGAGLEGAF